jgi:glycine/D-amino acid oxidase-like deaminating enzyme/nitrite reductase/ring-hydroxylating ferredoxin subunit
MDDRSQPMTPRGTTSIWMDVPIPHTRGRLPFRSATDVCIVGGGITGLTTAYLLARAGKRVVVLEAGELGSGETGRTTAHLSSALDDRFEHLEKLHGAERTRLAAESHARAIDSIEEIVRSEQIDCGFRRVDGFLYLGPNDTHETLIEEAEAASRAGLEVELLDVPSGPALSAGPCLRFGRQAQMNPLRYLAGLVRGIERMGGVIYTRAHVSRFESGVPTRASTDAGEMVTAASLVVATNTPVNDRLVIHSKQAAMRTYALAFEIPRGAVPVALYWDNDDPYHYVRIDDTMLGGPSDLLIVGGEDHRTGHEDRPQPRWDRLEAWTRRIIPQAGAIVRRWSGQVFEPADGLAFIGKNPADGPGVFVATGDSGHGMTHGTIAGLMLTEMTQGRDHPWAHLYDPRRRTLGALGTFAKENLDIAAQYARWVMPGEVRSEDEIPRGEGATLLEHGHRLAVFRDADGDLHRCKAVCTHLGGIVRWNSAEKTWDCPCHGARYDRRGHVITGPAPHDLAQVPEPQKREAPSTPGGGAVQTSPRFR